MSRNSKESSNYFSFFLPVSSITDEFNRFKVTLKRFPSSRCQRLWGLILQKGGKNMTLLSAYGQVNNETQ